MGDNRNHQDDARAIPIGSYGTPRGPVPLPQQLPLSWSDATKLFFTDHSRTVFVKMAARYLPAALGFIGVADDIAIPGLGLADEGPTIVFIGWCLYRINKYRTKGK